MGPGSRASRSAGTTAVLGAAFILLVSTQLALAPARADDIAAFYKDKTVTLTVSASAGGGYDTLARIVARFLRKHLPGNPIVVVRNMAGARGGAATSFLYSGAEKDGTHIGLLQSSTPFEPLLGTREARFDPRRFNWLGTPSVETGLFVVWNATPINSLADARARETTVGAAGATSTAAFHARLLNHVFGFKLKIVGGYPGQTETLYAMERGEIEGYTSIVYSALQATKADLLPEKKIKAILQYGPEKLAELAQVPYAADVAGSEDDRTLLNAAFAPLALGRPLALPPDVPADRLAAMRRALADTFADPGFTAESTRLALGSIAPRSGEQVRQVIERVYAAPTPVLDRLRKLHTVPP